MKNLLVILLITNLISSCSTLIQEDQRTLPVKNENVAFNSLWNYSDPVKTRELFIQHKEENQNQDKDYLLQLETQIARTHSLRAEFSEAHNILDNVEKNLTDDTPVANVRYSLERGRAFNSNNEKKKASLMFEKAYKDAKGLGLDNYTIDAAHMVAIAVSTLDEKIKWSKLGIKAATESQNEKVKGWIGVFHNNSGWDLFEAKRYEEAMEHFVQCRDFHQGAGSKEGLKIANWSIAKTLRMQGQYERALEIHMANLEVLNGDDASGYTDEELGELYLVLDQKDKSIEHFRKAYAILSQDIWLQKNEAARLERMKKLAN